MIEESLLHPGMELIVAHLKMHLQRMMQEAEGVLIEEQEAKSEVEVEN